MLDKPATKHYLAFSDLTLKAVTVLLPVATGLFLAMPPARNSSTSSRQRIAVDTQTSSQPECWAGRSRGVRCAQGGGSALAELLQQIAVDKLSAPWQEGCRHFGGALAPWTFPFASWCTRTPLAPHCEDMRAPPELPALQTSQYMTHTASYRSTNPQPFCQRALEPCRAAQAALLVAQADLLAPQALHVSARLLRMALPRITSGSEPSRAAKRKREL